MLGHFIANRAIVERLRSGVIGSHLDAFVESLAGLGYAPATVRLQVGMLGRFDRWMARRRLRVTDLSERVLDWFLASRTRRAGVHRGEVTAIRRFLAYLRGCGATGPATSVVDAAPLSLLQRQYERYLTTERGLAPATLTNYGGFFWRFLTERFGEGPMELRALTAADISPRTCRATSSSMASGAMSRWRRRRCICTPICT